MKKLLSLLSAFALTAMVVMPVMAANANPTLLYTDAGTLLNTTDDTLRITVPHTVVSTNKTVTVSLKDSSGVAVDLNTTTPVTVASISNVSSATVVNDTSGEIDVVVVDDGLDAVFLVTFNSDNNLSQGNYTVIASGTDGFGAAVFPVLSANVVNITATVLPTLTFDVTPLISDLGVLTEDYSNTDASVDLTYATNANGGLVVDMTSVGLKDGTTASDNELGVTSINATVPNVAGTEYRYTTATGTDGADSNDGTNGTDIGATQAVVPSTGAPTPSTITNVKVNSAITALTPAGDYADTLTFTATATF